MRLLYISLLFFIALSCSPAKSDRAYFSPTGTHELRFISDDRVEIFNVEIDSKDTGNYRFQNDSIIVNQKYMGQMFGDSLYLNGILYTPEQPETAEFLSEEQLIGRQMYLHLSDENREDTLHFRGDSTYYSGNRDDATRGGKWYLLERDKRQYLTFQQGLYRRLMLVKQYDSTVVWLAYFHQNQREVLEIQLKR